MKAKKTHVGALVIAAFAGPPIPCTAYPGCGSARRWLVNAYVRDADPRGPKLDRADLTGADVAGAAEAEMSFHLDVVPARDGQVHVARPWLR